MRPASSVAQVSASMTRGIGSKGKIRSEPSAAPETLKVTPMRRNILSARAQISVNCAGRIENIASMTAAQPIRGWLERSSISSKTLASVLYAAQKGTVLPVSETVEVIVTHPTAAVGAEFSIASVTGIIRIAIDGPESGRNFGGGLREIGLVSEVGCEQVSMRAGVRNRAVVDEEDAVASGEGAGAMGDDDDDTIARERGEGFYQFRFGRGIERRGGLVEDDYFGAAKQGACDCNSFFLSDRQVRAAPTENRRVSVGQPIDKFRGACHRGRLADVGRGRAVA